MAGAPPDPEKLLAALRTHDLFTYCGHGAGERYLGGEGGEKLRAQGRQVPVTATETETETEIIIITAGKM
jgi:hypothetical protein